MTGGIAELGTGGHNVTQSQLTSGSVLNSAVSGFVSGQNAGSDDVPASVPKAFLNWILFDEQFNVVSGSGFDQVGANNTLKKHVKSNMPITS